MSFLVTTSAASTGIQASTSAKAISPVMAAVNKMQEQILTETRSGNDELNEFVQSIATILKAGAEEAADLEKIQCRYKNANAKLAAIKKSYFDELDLNIAAKNRILESQNRTIATLQASIATLQQHNASLAAQIAAQQNKPPVAAPNAVAINQNPALMFRNPVYYVQVHMGEAQLHSH